VNFEVAETGGLTDTWLARFAALAAGTRTTSLTSYVTVTVPAAMVSPAFGYVIVASGFAVGLGVAAAHAAARMATSTEAMSGRITAVWDRKRIERIS
jgi:hypothetical protein